ncbi:hypothetical protein ACHAW6_002747 [Cyclotella cf. meneghiniana]
MASANHRKSRAAVHPPPPPPRRVPFVPPPPPSTPPVSSNKPTPMVKLDGSLHQAFPPPPRTNKSVAINNLSRKNSLPGPSVSRKDFNGVNKQSLKSNAAPPHKKVSCAVSTGAGSSVGSGMYSASFMEILKKVDTTTEEAENMLKLLKLAKQELSSSIASDKESDSQHIDSVQQESLDRELEGLTYFPVGRDNPPRPYDALTMLYGEDSRMLLKDPSDTSTRDSLVGPGKSASGGAPLLTDRQLTALFAMDASFLEEIDPTSFEEKPQGKRASSSPELVRSLQSRVRSKSRESLCRDVRRRSPLPRRISNTLSRKDSNCSADSLFKMVSSKKTPSNRDRLIRSRSCEPGFHSTQFSGISPSPQNTASKRSTRNTKAKSDKLKRTCSEGMGTRHKVVTAPPTQTQKKSATSPPVSSLPKRRTSAIDKNEGDDVHCLSDSYAKMLTIAQRMSSNRSFDEEITKSPSDKQYWKGLRGRPKSENQANGEAKNTRIRTKSRDTYDSCGEMSGAEASQISRSSRKDKSKRMVAKQRKTLVHEKLNQNKTQERCDLTQNSRRHQYKGGENHLAASSSSTKKSGIAAFLQKSKERCANSLGTAATGSTDFISSSLSTADSRSTRRSRQSSVSRKSFESGRSKKSIKSMLSSKIRVRNRSKKESLRRASSMGLCSTSLVRTFEREESLLRRSMPDPILSSSIRSSSSMGSGSILSAAADIFQNQSISVNINRPVIFDDASSCSSSLSCYSDDESDCDDVLFSEESNLMPMMASVAEAVEYINGHNEIEKFVSKVKHFL